MSPLNYILGNDGRPVPEPDLLAWARWLEDADRRVELTGIEDDAGLKITVSTVFLATDHSFSMASDAAPVLWESMVFGGQHPHGGYCDRYTSRADAEAGHAAIVRLIVNTWPAGRRLVDGGADGAH